MLTGWANFFLAQVGAAAALTGLIFVAVSINLTKILAYPTLPGRALEALLYLLTVLVIGTLGLVPGQPAWLLGVEILGVWLIVCAVTLTNQLRALRAPEARSRRGYVYNLLLGQLATLPFLVAGGTLVVGKGGEGGGVYWLVPGVLLCILNALKDAWVLLVEINR